MEGPNKQQQTTERLRRYLRRLAESGWRKRQKNSVPASEHLVAARRPTAKFKGHLQRLLSSTRPSVIHASVLQHLVWQLVCYPVPKRIEWELRDDSRPRGPKIEAGSGCGDLWRRQRASVQQLGVWESAASSSSGVWVQPDCSKGFHYFQHPGWPLLILYDVVNFGSRKPAHQCTLGNWGGNWTRWGNPVKRCMDKTLLQGQHYFDVAWLRSVFFQNPVNVVL